MSLCNYHLYQHSFFIIILIALIAFIHTLKSDVCQTQACFATSKRIASAMDPSADPCDDFYQFSCGNWLKNNKIPEDRAWWSIWSSARLNLKKQIKKLLETPYDPQIHSTRTAQKAITFYKECMDTERREKVGVYPLLKMLKVIGGWPMITRNWDEAGFNWLKSYIFLRSQLGTNYIFKIYVDLDVMNTSQRVIYLDAPNFGIGSKEFTTDFEVPYKRYIKTLAVLLNFANVSSNTIDHDIHNVYDFERKLVSLMSDVASRKDHFNSYYKMTFGSLQKYFKNINWRYLFYELFKESNMDYNDDYTLIMEDLNYFKGLTRLLKRTPKRVIANYLGWRFIYNFADYTVREFRHMFFEYQKLSEGITRPEKNWEFCYSLMNTYFNYIIGRLYIDNFFNSSTVNEIESMTKYIIASFKDSLSKQTWMNRGTRIRAKQKLSNMLSNVAFQPWLKSDDQIEKYYHDMGDVIPGHFLETIYQFQKYNSIQKLNSLMEPVNRETIRLSGPATINAYNYFDLNYIQFPAAILQPPFYSTGVPAVLNFGAIGKTIGHEIIHSFDDEGKQYDKDGNLKNWWSPLSEKRYNEKAQCFVDQYDNYQDDLTGLYLNGFITQGENIADNGGIRIAYKAYKNYINKNGRQFEQRLPGQLVNFTSDQLFFISFASIWCEKERYKSMQSTIINGIHSPSKFRVIGTLTNSHSFASAFNCPIDSKMNPRKKCILW